MKLKILTAIAAALLITGCATSQPITYERGDLDLTFDAGSKAKTKSQTIAIVSPRFNQPEKPAQQGYNNPLLAAYQAQNVQVDFNLYFHDREYANRLATAMGDGFQQLVTTKGFKFIGPYRNFDEITYTDKRDAYLAIIPDVDLRFNKNPNDNGCSGGACYETGTISVGGDFSFKLVEPLTQQTFLTKRVALSELKVSKPYRYVYKNTSQQNAGLAGMLIEGAVQQISNAANGGVQQNSNTDTTDKALVEAINEFYQIAMERMDMYLSDEEILSFSRDVANLKQQKRY